MKSIKRRLHFGIRPNFYHRSWGMIHRHTDTIGYLQIGNLGPNMTNKLYLTNTNWEINYTSHNVTYFKVSWVATVL